MYGTYGPIYSFIQPEGLTVLTQHGGGGGSPIDFVTYYHHHCIPLLLMVQGDISRTCPNDLSDCLLLVLVEPSPLIAKLS